MKEIYHKWIMIILGSIIAFAVGYFMGFASGIRFMVTKAVDFLRYEGVDFSLTAQQIAELIIKYTGWIQSV